MIRTRYGNAGAKELPSRCNLSLVQALAESIGDPFMTGAVPPGEVEARTGPLGPPPGPSQVRRASGIYGMVVTGAVFASAGGQLKTLPLAIAVIVTLVVYWLAEEYAEVGEHASAGRLPSRAQIQAALAEKWPMVTASYVPLAMLLGARVLGATPMHAAYFALGVTVVLLTYYGWSAGRTSGLHGRPLFLMTAAAGSLGLVMIGLKLLINHLH